MLKSFNRRMVLTLLAAACGAGMGGIARAQGYPDRPIRMIIPFPPGGGLDTIGRVVAAELSKQLNVSVVVDNRGGASGAIGVEAAVRAPSDGYTILFSSSDTLTILPLLRKLPFDTAKDLRPLAKVADLYIVFATNPAVPAKSVQELVTLAKSEPGKLRFASPGIGSVSHMTFEGFKLRTHTNIQHVPYNGGGPAQVAVMGNQVEILSGGANLYKVINAGKLRGISISSATRNPLLPDVPTLVESGLKDYVFGSWFGFFVGIHTPDPIVAKLQEALRKTTQTQEFKEMVESGGGVPGYSAGKEFSDYMAKESERWKEIVDQANIRMD
ncbi:MULTISPECIES: tripartite tricarboxylate transporter substrate binding protein [unclassified Pigmentiphaga]|uniref:Bug family tripartite tricarboxylate transporter substrate binding protein n=1 Tax=unclassified Pigmentiphaga TaxID=2626614 RepID=UPI001404D2AF|nr:MULTISPECIES: tripartite tricarboxylate transporter substrate binding protein [unclassified Pigmentiphaga]